MNEQPKRQKRWFKKRYIPVVLLGAFVLWGLWPMLATRWDQDQCSFGEVTNERYWQMREEVREDVERTLVKIKTSYSIPLSQFMGENSIDLDEITKRFPLYTSKKIYLEDPKLILRLARGVLLSKLVQKFTQKVTANDQKLAYTHAILREFGGWFRYSEQSPNKKGLLYLYAFPTGALRDSLGGFLNSLINRHSFFYARFLKNDNFNLRHLYYQTMVLEVKNIQKYFRWLADRGCPDTNLFTKD